MTILASPCRFDFSDAVAGFFEMSTDEARAIVPAGIEPIERNHGQAVLAVLAFDFHGGDLGAYTEVVLAVLVAPLVEPGVPMAHSAMYPFLLGTSTLRAREHGVHQYRLPHYPRNVDVRFQRRPDHVSVLGADGRPFLEMTVTRPAGVPSTTVRHRYQIFATDAEGTWMSDVFMAGELAEHEEETGGIVLHPHAFTEVLRDAGVSSWPFREQWMSRGSETYHPVRALR